MNIIEIWETVESIRKTKAEITEVFQSVKDDETYLGALAILANECAEFHQLYEKEAAELPKLVGAEW